MNMNPVSIFKVTVDALPEQLKYEPAPLTLDEASALIPDGAYTTFRTYDNHRRVIGLTSHLERLKESTLGLAANLPVNSAQIVVNPAGIRACLYGVLDQFSAPAEVRVRLSVDLTRQPGTIYIAIQALQPLPPQIYAAGVHLASSGLSRRQPTLKQTSFITESQFQRQHMPPGIFELLLLDETGAILEGMTSNFFAVRQGTIYTASTDILAGVTRKILLEIISQAGLPVVFETVKINSLETLDEAFITSSSRGVVPVVCIDGQWINNGQPGPVAKHLLALYDRFVAEQAELIK